MANVSRIVRGARTNTRSGTPSSTTSSTSNWPPGPMSGASLGSSRYTGAIMPGTLPRDLDLSTGRVLAGTGPLHDVGDAVGVHPTPHEEVHHAPDRLLQVVVGHDLVPVLEDGLGRRHVVGRLPPLAGRHHEAGDPAATGL